MMASITIEPPQELNNNEEPYLPLIINNSLENHERELLKVKSQLKETRRFYQLLTITLVMYVVFLGLIIIFLMYKTENTVKGCQKIGI